MEQCVLVASQYILIESAIQCAKKPAKPKTKKFPSISFQF